MNRVDVESAVIAMGDVAVCIKMVDDATEEGNAVQQGRAVQVLMDLQGQICRSCVLCSGRPERRAGQFLRQ